LKELINIQFIYFIIFTLKDQQMLYNVNSPYYRQFLSSTVNKKYQKNLEKLQGAPSTATTENRGNVNPGSVGV